MRDPFHKSCSEILIAAMPPQSQFPRRNFSTKKPGIALIPCCSGIWPAVSSSPREGNSSDQSHPFLWSFSSQKILEKSDLHLQIQVRDPGLKNSNFSRSWTSFLQLQHYPRLPKPIGASVIIPGKRDNGATLRCFLPEPTANSGKGARTRPRIPKKNEFHSQKCQLPITPTGSSQARMLPCSCLQGAGGVRILG